MKKSKLIVIISAAVLVLLLIGGFVFFRNFTILNGQVYSKSNTTLDLSGVPFKDFQVFEDFPQLQLLDLRNTGITVEEYEQLKAALPNCEIQWLLPFQGSYLPLDTQSIAVSSLSEADLSLLSYLPKLETVDATACSDYDLIFSLKEQYPDVDVSYVVQVGDTQVEDDCVSIVSADVSDIQHALQYLPQLEVVDATECTDLDALIALKAQYPNCRFIYNVPFCGQLWPQDTKHMKLLSSNISDLDTVLPYLSELSQITITRPVADPENISAFLEAHPEIQLSCDVTVLGQTIPYDSTQLNIAGMQLTSMDELESILPLLPKLEKVDMCGCGYSDEEMAALNQRHPDTLFVWEVQIAYFKVRTDVTYFMPYQYGFVYTDDVVDKLKYLTELICIDMGHANISRSDFLAYMPKLQYLLICDTDITDISYCANMKDLKYVELFMTKVTDFSPLLECKSIVDLNVSYTNPDDPMIFTQMTWLKNFWFRGYWGTLNHDEIVKALPNTKVVTGHGSSTALGWRKLPNYYAQRDILGMPYTLED